MRYHIKVIPNAKENSVKEVADTLVVRTTEQPEHGKANKAILKLLSDYFNKPVRLVSGATSRRKVVEVL